MPVSDEEYETAKNALVKYASDPKVSQGDIDAWVGVVDEYRAARAPKGNSLTERTTFLPPEIADAHGGDLGAPPAPAPEGRPRGGLQGAAADIRAVLGDKEPEPKALDNVGIAPGNLRIDMRAQAAKPATFDPEGEAVLLERKNALYDKNLPSASGLRAISRPPEFVPPTPSDGGLTPLGRTVAMLPSFAGGKVTHFVEPTPEQFLRDTGLDANANKDAFNEFKDAKWKEVYDAAEAAGVPVVRTAYAKTKEWSDALMNKGIVPAVATASGFAHGADRAFLGIPSRLTGTHDENAQRLEENSPVAATLGAVAGMVSPNSAGGLAVSGARALPGVGGFLASGGLLPSVASGAIAAGTDTAANQGVSALENHSLGEFKPKEILASAAEGGALGGGLDLLGRFAGLHGQNLRENTPLGKAEAAGARTGPLAGVVPSAEYKALDKRGGAVETLADRMVNPLHEEARLTHERARADVAGQNEAYYAAFADQAKATEPSVRTGEATEREPAQAGAPGRLGGGRAAHPQLAGPEGEMVPRAPDQLGAGGNMVHGSADPWPEIRKVAVDVMGETPAASAARRAQGETSPPRPAEKPVDRGPKSVKALADAVMGAHAKNSMENGLGLPGRSNGEFRRLLNGDEEVAGLIERPRVVGAGRASIELRNAREINPDAERMSLDEARRFGVDVDKAVREIGLDPEEVGSSHEVIVIPRKLDPQQLDQVIDNIDNQAKVDPKTGAERNPRPEYANFMKGGRVVRDQFPPIGPAASVLDYPLAPGPNGESDVVRGWSALKQHQADLLQGAKDTSASVGLSHAPSVRKTYDEHQAVFNALKSFAAGAGRSPTADAVQGALARAAGVGGDYAKLPGFAATESLVASAKPRLGFGAHLNLGMPLRLRIDPALQTLAREGGAARAGRFFGTTNPFQLRGGLPGGAAAAFGEDRRRPPPTMSPEDLAVLRDILSRTTSAAP